MNANRISHALRASAFFAVLVPSAMLAQLRTDDMLRTRLKTGAESEGRLVSFDSESITLLTSPRDSLRLLRLEIQQVERRDGSHRIGIGALIAGAVIGIGVGIKAGATQRENDQNSGGLLVPDAPYRGIGAVIGALIGATVGGCIGLIEIPTWRTVFQAPH